MENINEPFEALVKATFKNKQAYDDFASGIVHSDKGLRVDNGNMVSQPDIASASKEDLLKELRKYPTEPRKEYYREPQYTRHYYEESERSYTLKDAVVDGFKEGIATAIINFAEDMLYNPVKREIFLTRSKNF